MKFSHSLLALSLTLPFSLRADDEKKPADSPKTEAATEAKDSPADAAWKEVEAMLRGPKERPKTMEEALPVYKKHFDTLDEKSAAFAKTYPADSRRWKLKLNQITSNGARKNFKAAALSEEEIAKLTAEILAAEDAEKDTKATVSFYSVALGDSDAPDYAKKVEAHKAAFPDFPANKQIDSMVKSNAKFAERVGKPLNISFTSTTGEEISIEKMKGKVILVDFWATWCGPCVAEIPHVVETYNKLHKSGFEIVGISFDKKGDEDKLAKMTKEKGMPWPQYFDGEGWKNKFGTEFGIQGIPAMWIVNKKGELTYINGRANLEKKVEKLLAE